MGRRVVETAPLREALKKIADWGWEQSRKPGDDPAKIAELAETALASPEPAVTEGLDVERLREAIFKATAFASTAKDLADVAASEYARLSAEQPE